MKRIRKRDLLARIESIEERLARPVPAPCPGQQAIPGATIGHPAHDDPDPHPRYEDYPTTRAYEEAFHLWRARQRDHRLNPQEHDARWDVIESALRNRPGAPGL